MNPTNNNMDSNDLCSIDGPLSPAWKLLAREAHKSAATVALAWEFTRGGRKFAEETGKRIYSPKTVHALALSITEPNGILCSAIHDILSECESDDLIASSLFNDDLYISIVYLRKYMLDLPHAAQTSVLASLCIGISSRRCGCVDGAQTA